MNEVLISRTLRKLILISIKRFSETGVGSAVALCMKNVLFSSSLNNDNKITEPS